jgi:hypothetical protein
MHRKTKLRTSLPATPWWIPYGEQSTNQIASGGRIESGQFPGVGNHSRQKDVTASF